MDRTVFIVNNRKQFCPLWLVINILKCFWFSHVLLRLLLLDLHILQCDKRLADNVKIIFPKCFACCQGLGHLLWKFLVIALCCFAQLLSSCISLVLISYVFPLCHLTAWLLAGFQYSLTVFSVFVWWSHFCLFVDLGGDQDVFWKLGQGPIFHDFEQFSRESCGLIHRIKI